MLVFNTVRQMGKWISQTKENPCSIGFVPTMGALHRGHISLIKQSVNENDVTVCSIFVNPIQFNNAEDLEKYPRTLTKDLKLLKKANCDVVFVPTVEEMYPDDVLEHYSFGALENVMEGVFRPGHFNGVAIVVKRLFNIVQPDKAYFGKKDFQQLVLIQELVNIENLPVRIVACPIVREKDGLAMSSRNRRLSLEARALAPKAYRILTDALQLFHYKSVYETEQFVVSEIAKEEQIRLEYFKIVDRTTLQESDNWDNPNGLIGCIAFWVGDVRLIDNIEFIK
jgi:pantoate--beta-alanine ligase